VCVCVCVSVCVSVRVEVRVAKLWRLGTALGATTADASINNIFYDIDANSAQAGIVTFSSTNDEWRYCDEEVSE